MILVSYRIPWLSKAPKVILDIKVVKIYWFKQLDDLSTLVLYVQLENRLELNIISELHHETYPPPPPQKPKQNWRVRYIKN